MSKVSKFLQILLYCTVLAVAWVVKKVPCNFESATYVTLESESPDSYIIVGDTGSGAALYRFIIAESRCEELSVAGVSPSEVVVVGEDIWCSANLGGGYNLMRVASGGALERIGGLPDGCDPKHLTQVGNIVYFQADGGNGLGSELWKLDKSGSGIATFVYDFKAGSPSSKWGSSVESPNTRNLGTVKYFQGKLYAQGDWKGSTTAPRKGYELVVYDPLGSDGKLVCDINPGTPNGNPTFLTPWGSDLYFKANSAEFGVSLWRFRSSNGNCGVVVNTGGESAYPEYITLFNDMLYFRYNEDRAEIKSELYSYAPGDGLNLVQNIDMRSGVSSSIQDIVIVNDTLLINAHSADDQEYYFAYSGDSAYPLVKIGFTGATTMSAHSSSTMVGFSDLMVFYVASYTGETTLPSHSTVNPETVCDSDINSITVMSEGTDSAWYFVGRDDSARDALFKLRLDGTCKKLTSYGVAITEIAPHPQKAEDEVICAAGSGSETNLYRWKSSKSKLQLVGGLPDGCNPMALLWVDDVLYFQADGDNGLGAELWKWEGGGDAIFVADVYFGAESSFWGVQEEDTDNPFIAKGSIHFDDKIYGVARYKTETGSNQGYELVAVDDSSTTASISQACDPVAGSNSFNPSGFTVYEGGLFFAARSDANGYELWRYGEGTCIVLVDANPGPASSNPRNFLLHRNFLYYADNGVIGSASVARSELWRFDTKTAHVAAMTSPSNENGILGPIASIGDSIVMTATSPTTGKSTFIWDDRVASTTPSQYFGDICDTMISNVDHSAVLALHTGSSPHFEIIKVVTPSTPPSPTTSPKPSPNGGGGDDDDGGGDGDGNGGAQIGGGPAVEELEVPVLGVLFGLLLCGCGSWVFLQTRFREVESTQNERLVRRASSRGIGRRASGARTSNPLRNSTTSPAVAPPAPATLSHMELNRVKEQLDEYRTLGASEETAVARKVWSLVLNEGVPLDTEVVGRSAILLQGNQLRIRMHIDARRAMVAAMGAVAARPIQVPSDTELRTSAIQALWKVVELEVDAAVRIEAARGLARAVTLGHVSLKDGASVVQRLTARADDWDSRARRVCVSTLGQSLSREGVATVNRRTRYEALFALEALASADPDASVRAAAIQALTSAIRALPAIEVPKTIPLIGRLRQTLDLAVEDVDSHVRGLATTARTFFTIPAKEGIVASIAFWFAPGFAWSFGFSLLHILSAFALSINLFNMVWGLEGREHPTQSKVSTRMLALLAFLALLFGILSNVFVVLRTIRKAGLKTFGCLPVLVSVMAVLGPELLLDPRVLSQPLPARAAKILRRCSRMADIVLVLAMVAVTLGLAASDGNLDGWGWFTVIGTFVGAIRLSGNLVTQLLLHRFQVLRIRQQVSVASVRGDDIDGDEDGAAESRGGEHMVEVVTRCRETTSGLRGRVLFRSMATEVVWFYVRLSLRTWLSLLFQVSANIILRCILLHVAFLLAKSDQLGASIMVLLLLFAQLMFHAFVLSRAFVSAPLSTMAAAELLSHPLLTGIAVFLSAVSNVTPILAISPSQDVIRGAMCAAETAWDAIIYVAITVTLVASAAVINGNNTETRLVQPELLGWVFCAMALTILAFLSSLHAPWKEIRSRLEQSHAKVRVASICTNLWAIMLLLDIDTDPEIAGTELNALQLQQLTTPSSETGGGSGRELEDFGGAAVTPPPSSVPSPLSDGAASSAARV